MKRIIHAILMALCLAAVVTSCDTTPTTTADSDTATVPSAPVLTATALSSSALKVSWSQIDDATGYKIYRSTATAGTYALIATFSTNTTCSFQDISLSAATAYYYKGIAVNAAGTSDESAVVTATTLASTDTTDNTDTTSVTLLDPPATVNLTVNSAKSITVTWSAVTGATGYVLYRSTDNASFSSIYSATSSSTTSYINTGLTGSTTYYYAVATTNEFGTGELSTATSATTSADTSSTPSNGNTSTRSIISSSDDVVANATFANTVYLNMSTPSWSTDNATFTTATSTETEMTDSMTIKFKNNKLSIDGSNATGATKLVLTGSTKDCGSTIGVSIKSNASYNIELYLDGVTISSGNYPCIEVTKASRTFVVLNGTNTFTDGRSYGTGYGDDYTDTAADVTDDIALTQSWVEKGADTKGSLYSKGQLLFSGTGTLSITAAYKHCVYSKDYIHIYGGTITTKNSGRNGVQSVNGFIMDGGTLSITGTGTNTNNQSRGIVVEGQESIEEDGVTPYGVGEGFIVITGGTITSNTVSKGMTAKWDVDDDAESTSTADDPYPYVQISGGTISMTTTGTPQDDSSSTYTFYDADGVSTTETTSLSPEGIEGKEDVFISGGKITLHTTDDGINASNTSGEVNISGGEIYVFSSDNDCIDSNGTLTISGGTIVSLCTTTPECAFDCDQNTFTITGGLLVGIGTSNFSEPTASACTQNAVVIAASYAPAGGTMAIANGTTCAFAFTVPSLSSIASTGGTSTYDVMVLSSPSLASNTTYTIYKNATVTGTDFNGLYTDIDDWTAGTSTGTFTTSATVTTVGSVSNGGSQEGQHTAPGSGTMPGQK